jgi:hypothetical protein
MAEIVDSRDVLVLLQGPSFAMFSARLHEFAGFDFAVASLNSFANRAEIATSGLSRKIRKGAPLQRRAFQIEDRSLIG